MDRKDPAGFRGDPRRLPGLRPGPRQDGPVPGLGEVVKQTVEEGDAAGQQPVLCDPPVPQEAPWRYPGPPAGLPGLVHVAETGERDTNTYLGLFIINKRIIRVTAP